MTDAGIAATPEYQRLSVDARFNALSKYFPYVGKLSAIEKKKYIARMESNPKPGENVKLNIETDLLYKALDEPYKDENNMSDIYPGNLPPAKSLKQFIFGKVAEASGDLLWAGVISAWFGVMVGLCAVAMRRITRKTGVSES